MNFSSQDEFDAIKHSTNEIFFSWFDYTIFTATLAMSTWIGIYFGCFGSKQSTTYEYLMGNKAMKPLPIALSLIAGHVSGATFILHPAEVYRYGAYFFLDIFPLILQGIATISIYLPVFYNLEITSIYEYLEKRFDRKARQLASFLYLLLAFLYLPVVTYTAALTCSLATGLNLDIVVPILCGVCIFYTSISGLKGVIWTDNFQFVIMTANMIIIFGLGLKFSEGLTTVWKRAAESQRLDIFNFDVDPTVRTNFWNFVLGYTAFRMTMNNALQSATQKYLTLPTFRDIKLCVIYYVVGMYIIQTFTTILGLQIYAKYVDCDPFASKAIRKSDQLVPYFALNVAGHIPGFPGLFTAGIVSAALSTLSVTWNGLAGTIYLDFLKSNIKRDITEKTATNILKLLVVIEGIVCMSMVYVIEHVEEIFPLGISFLAVSYGPMLGIFSLGLLFPKANSKGAFYGTLVGLVSSASIIFPSKYFEYRGWIKESHKPVSTDGCQFFNNTILAYSTNTLSNATAYKEPYIPSVFKISFQYHTLLGALITTVVGLIISYATNKNEPPVDKKLICPISRFLLYRRTEASEMVDYSSVQDALKRVNTENESGQRQKM